MKFSVVGADKESGDDVDLVLMASDQAAAEAEACKRGVMVSAIKILEDDKDSIALVDDEPPASKDGTVAGASVAGGTAAGKAASGASTAGKTHGAITLNASSPSDTAHTGDGTAAIGGGIDMSKAAMEYHIVMNQALYLLETAVNKYIKDGWEPQGGLSIGMSNNALQYFQALVRKKK